MHPVQRQSLGHRTPTIHDLSSGFNLPGQQPLRPVVRMVFPVLGESWPLCGYKRESPLNSLMRDLVRGSHQLQGECKGKGHTRFWTRGVGAGA